MKELKEFVDRENKFATMLKAKPLSLKSATDRAKIADKIDCALSPENLTCDGELRGSQVRAKHTFLIKAGTQLIQLDPAVKIYELSY